MRDADEYLLVTRDSLPHFRVDIRKYVATPFFDAGFWNRRLVVGFDETVWFIDPTTFEYCMVPVPTYFRGFRSLPDGLLIASGSHLLRVDPAFRVVWQVELAADGVIVDDISGNRVRGNACLDPFPEIWKPFCVDLDTGAPIQV